MQNIKLEFQRSSCQKLTYFQLKKSCVTLVQTDTTGERIVHLMMLNYNDLIHLDYYKI